MRHGRAFPLRSRVLRGVNPYQRLFSLFATQRAEAGINTAAAYEANDSGVIAALQKAVAAGITYSYYTNTMALLKPSGSGGASFWDYVDRWAANTGVLPLSLLIESTKPGGAQSIPSDLMGQAFNATAVKDCAKELIDELAARPNNILGRLRNLTFFNEAHDYANVDAGTRVAQMADFQTEITAYAASVFGPTLRSSVCFNYPAAAAWGTNGYDALKAACTRTTWTLFPINYTDFSFIDFTSGGADGLGTRLGDILTATGGATVDIQETAHATSTVWGGSEAMQTLYVQAWFETILPVFGGAIGDINFLWEHDLKSELLDEAGLTGDPREFIGSMGFINAFGSHKEAWPILASYLHGSPGVSGDGALLRLMTHMLH